MTDPEMGNMEDHYPQRGSQVEAWLKDRRDLYQLGSPDYSDIMYQTVDGLLREYQEAADGMMSLFEVVNGKHPEPEPSSRRPKKKKVKP